MDDRSRRDSSDDDDSRSRRDLNRDERYPYNARYGYRELNEYEARERYEREIDDAERAERERERIDRERDESPRRRRRFGRWYGSTGRLRAVGTAAGYSGFGGPGWTSGGFGDPGYNTSGFGSPDYGTSRTGAGWNMGEDRSVAASLGSGLDREFTSGVGGSHWNVPGPHRGKGPKGYTRSDERLREEISERLLAHGAVDATDIDVTVENGVARLSGSVVDRDMKWIAEEIAQSVFGVRDVENHLRIGRAN